MTDPELDLLFEAFVAGFEESGEGYNGEYVHSSIRGNGELERRLRARFDAWLAEPDDSA